MSQVSQSQHRTQFNIRLLTYHSTGMTFSKYPYPFVSIFFSVCKCSSEKTQQFKDHTTSSVIKAFWCYSLSQSFFPSLLLGIVITSNRCQPFQYCCTSHRSIFLPWGLHFFLLTPMPVIWSQLFQQKYLRFAHDHGSSCFSSSCHPLSSSFPCLQSRYCFVCSNHQGCLRPTPLNLQSSASCLIYFDRELLLHIRRINVISFYKEN